MRLSAVQCLSYVMEVMEKEHLKEADKSSIIQLILGNIIIDDVPHTTVAVEAFARIADLAESYFENKEAAGAIMG